jgi:hypothetical protein
MDSEAEVQPNGIDISPTILAVNEILFTPEFAAEIRTHNNWSPDLSDERTALLFLAARYQSSVDLLSRQTVTLKQQVDGLERRIVAFEDTDTEEDIG